MGASKTTDIHLNRVTFTVLTRHMGHLSFRSSRHFFTFCLLFFAAIAAPVVAESKISSSEGDTIVSSVELDPAIAPESEAAVVNGEMENQSILVASELTNDIDPSGAITVRHINTPIPRLQLLIEPLALQELDVEAAAWFLLLRDKVQHISSIEIAIKIENQATAEESAAQKLIQEALVTIGAAEADLDTATLGSPDYRRAIKELEVGKEKLYLAEGAINQALRTMREFQEDPLLQEELSRAKRNEKLEVSRRVRNKSLEARTDYAVGSEEYRSLTRDIDIFDKSFLKLAELETDLKDTVPQSPEYLEIEAAITKLQDAIISHALAIADAELVSDAAATRVLRSDINVFQYLDNIEDELLETERILREEAQNHTEGSGDRILQQLDQLVTELDEAIAIQRELKDQLLKNVVELQAEEIRIIDRFRVILNELETKGGDVGSYRDYINAIQTFEFDITDTQALQVRIISWLQSEEGGIRLGIGLMKFVGILASSVIVAVILTRIVGRFLDRIDGISALLKEFILVVVQRGVLVTGLLIALTSLGISLGPALALFGGISFVLAFALQSNLSNFASGLMLLINKPFDVGDEVKIQNYLAFVEAISLVNTKLKDTNGNLITLPNNTVWGGDIVNYSHSDKRRLAFKFLVKFDQDIDQLKQMWFEIAAAQPEILEDPGPSLSCPWNAKYEYSITVSLKAWCATPRYRPVYLSTLQVLQEKIAELGIELAAPTQHVKLQNEDLEPYLLEGDRPSA